MPCAADHHPNDVLNIKSRELRVDGCDKRNRALHAGPRRPFPSYTEASSHVYGDAPLLMIFNALDPNIMTHEQVDRGAIKYVMQGANIMCPGKSYLTFILFTDVCPYVRTDIPWRKDD